MLEITARFECDGWDVLDKLSAGSERKERAKLTNSISKCPRALLEYYAHHL